MYNNNVQYAFLKATERTVLPLFVYISSESGLDLYILILFYNSFSQNSLCGGINFFLFLIILSIVAFEALNKNPLRMMLHVDDDYEAWEHS